ncbi:hypothetical protein [Pseudomonas guariconensis]|uniref:hypothetical protein n=1 Tax=Pseudomonas guariconensis TaxID=1288410 RepID=UPI002B051B72|nr:hypothetical protein [Pseudomonas guariconensis]
MKSNQHPLFLHHNRGVKALAYTVREDREIKQVRTAAFNGVVNQQDGRKYIVTKGLCATASRLGRIKLVPYTGRFPRLALLWARLKEIVRD